MNDDLMMQMLQSFLRPQQQPQQTPLAPGFGRGETGQQYTPLDALTMGPQTNIVGTGAAAAGAMGGSAAGAGGAMKMGAAMKGTTGATKIPDPSGLSGMMTGGGAVMEGGSDAMKLVQGVQAIMANRQTRKLQAQAAADAHRVAREGIRYSKGSRHFLDRFPELRGLWVTD